MNEPNHSLLGTVSERPLEAQMTFKNLDFYYGKYHALKSINLDIYKQHVTAFIGPSGCGKSTLLPGVGNFIALLASSLPSFPACEF